MVCFQHVSLENSHSSVFVLTPTKSRPDYAIDAHEDVRHDDSCKCIQNTSANHRVLLQNCICCAGVLTYKVYGLLRRSG